MSHRSVFASCATSGSINFQLTLGGANGSLYSITERGDYLIDANGMGHGKYINNATYKFITLKIFLNL